MSTHSAVGGPVLNRSGKILLALGVLAFLIVAWRFAVGLGPTTGLNDGYPFGLWIAFDVVTGTALACGGYAVALLVYILNRGKYHPLVRPALLTSALGYTLAGLAVVVDVGRPWWIWKVPLFFWRWNLNSALLEVALCIMAYVFVLWIELSPAFLERWEESAAWPKLARFARRARPKVEKALPWLIALGIVLPTMHQSSLGTVMLLAGPKLHPLWNTPLLPLLFLLGAIAMGYGIVVMESALSSRILGRRSEAKMLAGLSSAMVVVLGLWLGIRVVDLLLRGRMALALEPTSYAFWFWLEMLVTAAALGMLLVKGRIQNLGWLFQASVLLLFGGALYRFSTYLMAFNPGDNWSY
ncbi:MAG TPA: Ni/Fe-hydrogenase cytochrome b subunit, partial [Thermoanaerobaculia bacterium]|nr:Ni/Fe-hydrogenase cytochrome b subunit [Thermoanaerobaculia bacterium]